MLDRITTCLGVIYGQFIGVIGCGCAIGCVKAADWKASAQELVVRGGF
jgi:hypothetical protein